MQSRLVVVAVAAAALLLQLGLVAAQAGSRASSASPFSSSIYTPYNGPPLGVFNSTNPRFQKPYNICTSDYQPFVACAGLEPSQYDGLQIALFKLWAKELGWKEEDYVFTCLPWGEMSGDVRKADGNCFMAAAGVEIGMRNLNAGVKYSHPFYKSGLQILISATRKSNDIWGFAKIFAWDVWLAMGLTAAVVAVVVYGIEKMNKSAGPKDVKDVQSWQWFSWAHMMQVDSNVGDPKTWAARAVLLAYGFLVVIMVHLYTVAIAVDLTTDQLSNSITGLADLPRRRVQTAETYRDYLKAYSVFATGQPWDTLEDQEAMIDKLRQGEFQALVLDAPLMQFYAATDPACQLFTVGDIFDTFTQGLAFPNAMDDNAIHEWNQALIRLQQRTDIFTTLDEEYVNIATSNCGRNHNGRATQGGGNASASVSFVQVAGLWVILLSTCGIGVVWTYIDHRKKQQAASGLPVHQEDHDDHHDDEHH